MNRDVQGNAIAERLLGYFNGGSASSIAELCDRSLTVTSAILASARSPNFPNPPGSNRLTELVAAARSIFPGVSFFGESVTAWEGGVVLSWRGEFKPDERSARLLSVPCSCRVRIQRDKVCGISFVVDEYSVLLQLGRICADPGKSSGSSAEVNQAAAHSLRDAFVAGKALRDCLPAEAILHVDIEIYRDINQGLETETLRLEGVGRMDDLLRFVRARFRDPVDVSLREGISQGYTTTFRGNIRARSGTDMLRYDLVIGFASRGARVAECWVKIIPPPTLLECCL
jgi:hypothetical protein